MVYSRLCVCVCVCALVQSFFGSLTPGWSRSQTVSSKQTLITFEDLLVSCVGDLDSSRTVGAAELCHVRLAHAAEEHGWTPAPARTLLPDFSV